MTPTFKQTSRESGNVLFLILIAVALFAALSYAVTSSTNSGGGNANEENNLVTSASIAQIPVQMKTAIIRQMVSKNVVNPDATGDLAADASGLLFDKPPFTGVATADEYRLVFHPNGGGASYAPATVGLITGADGEWVFTKAYEIENVGSTTNADLAGNEIIAFLPGITSSVCDKINEEVGITGVVDINNTNVIDLSATVETLVEGATLADGGDANLGATDHAPGIAGKPYGCINNDGTYVYYHVLLEG